MRKPLCVLLIFLLATPTFSAIREVGPGKTYTTIADGIAAATSGVDTVLVYEDTYFLSSQLNVNKDITLDVNPGDTPTIDCQGLVTTGCVNLNANGITMSGAFEIKNYGVGSNGYGLYISNARTGIIVDGVKVSGGIGAGIYATGNNGPLLIQNCEVYGATGNYGDGVSLLSSTSSDGTFANGTILRGCAIHDNNVDGVKGGGTWITLDDNNIYSNINAGPAHSDGLQMLPNWDHLRINNNTFRNHTQNIFLECIEPAISGTIDTTASTTVIGVNTLFLSQVQVGYHLEVSGQSRVVESIQSDTELTVTVAFSDLSNDPQPNAGNVTPCTDALVSGNVVYNDAGTVNGRNLDLVGVGLATPTLTSQCEDLKVYNNTFGRHFGTGIAMAPCATGVAEVKNNIISNNLGSGFNAGIESSCTGWLADAMEYNQLSSVTAGNLFLMGCSPTTYDTLGLFQAAYPAPTALCDTCDASTASFVTYGSDFHPAVQTPILGDATACTAAGVDMDGNTRTNCTLGAFEFSGGGSPLIQTTVGTASCGTGLPGCGPVAITVGNIGTAEKPSPDLVSVVLTLDSDLTLTACSGTGWTCDVPTKTATRTDALAIATDYPDISATFTTSNKADGNPNLRVTATTTVANIPGTSEGFNTPTASAWIGGF